MNLKMSGTYEKWAEIESKEDRLHGGNKEILRRKKPPNRLGFQGRRWDAKCRKRKLVGGEAEEN